MGAVMKVVHAPDTEWNSATAPEEGAIVNVLAKDNLGQYSIPFPVLFRDDRWWNASSGKELDTFIVGWRPAAKTKLTSIPNDPGTKQR